MRQLDLGGILVDTFGDGADLDFSMRRLLPDAPDELLDELAAVYGARHVDAARRSLRLSMHSFLIRTRHHVILVDTCLGNDKERPARPHFHHRNTPYLANLRALGVEPADVDFVLCTHFHSDHVGWNTILADGRWVPTFPNARYIMARREYDHWAACAAAAPRGTLLHGAFDDSILPVVAAGQAVMVDESDHICDQVRYEYAPGHSPGNVVIHVDGTARSGICSGDVIHSVVQLRYPDLLTSCDDPQAARATRQGLLERVADSSTLLLPAHFQDPTAGRVVRGEIGYDYAFVD